MTTEQRFHAAVNVIRSLPKSGSYQPSNDLMLRFYSYFKQATEGKCTKSKPGFWDLVNRAKWDAWTKLDDMSKETAMEAYVAELHKIVETMSYTDNVAAFFDTVDSDIAVSKDDLLLVAGDVFKKTHSSPPTPTGTREVKTDQQQHHNGYGSMNGHSNGLNGHGGHLDSEDEYIDTVDSDESEIHTRHLAMSHMTLANGHATFPASENSSYNSIRNTEVNTKILDEIRKTVSSLEKDVSLLKERVKQMQDDKTKQEKSLMWRRPRWWPMQNISPALFAIIIVWPVVANRLVSAVRRRK